MVQSNIIRKVPLFFLFSVPLISNSYIGNQSFRLTDDYEYRSYLDSVEDAHRSSEHAERESRKIASTLQVANQRLNETKKQIADLPSQISIAEQNKQNLQNQLKSLQTEADRKRFSLTEEQNNTTHLSSQIQNLKNDLSQAENQHDETLIGNIKAQIFDLENKKSLSENRSKSLSDSVRQTEFNIKSQQKELALNEEKKQILTQNLANLQNQLPQIEAQAQRLREDSRRSEEMAHHAREEFRRVRAAFDSFSQNLEMQINQFNSSGASKGNSDGQQDGSEMAQTMGTSSGNQDGLRDGDTDGESSGRYRDYNSGQQYGLQIGRQEGITDGTQNGKQEGITQALIDMGQKEGTTLGIDQAIKSDASQVGIKQGTDAGLDRAAATGKIQGIKIANEQGQKKYESVQLKKMQVNGPYSGLFYRVTPHLPANFRGRNYSPSTSYGREILRIAFIDGYNAMYDSRIYSEFERMIASIYNNAYDPAYSSSYQSSFSKTYKDSYNRGYNDGYNAVYSDQYENSRKSQYRISYNETVSHPDRTSATYQDSFKEYQKSAYAAKYEEIRKDSYIKTESDTFNSHIATRTEEARQKREPEVDALYINNAVLVYGGAQIYEGGVSRITKPDGVFQPSETVLYDVVIKNYGHKPLSNASIVSSTGDAQALPEIPAETELTIHGAITSLIDSKLVDGNSFASSIRIKAPLTTSDGLQADHYQGASSQLLVDSDVKQIKVFYPLYMNGLANSFNSLRAFQTQKLLLTVRNFSRFAYTDIDVHLVSNASTDLFTTKFKTIPNLSQGLMLDDGAVTPQNIDVGKTIEIRGVLKYKNIVVGVLEKPIFFKVTK